LKISLILPVYNPAPEWADIVLAKSDELKNFYPDIEFETIVVNDGSVSSNFTEGKKKLISTSINLIEYHPNQGKGEAIRTGVRASAGDLIIYTDIDFPYTMDSMCLVIDTLRGGKQDIVIGIKDDSYYAHVPAIRRLISRFLRMLIRFFFRIPTFLTLSSYLSLRALQALLSKPSRCACVTILNSGKWTLALSETSCGIFLRYFLRPSFEYHNKYAA
jgi:glycosyltransferase involved in cell wall biosynthesis